MSTIVKDNDNLIFQTIDWNFFHEEDDNKKKKYFIRLFGRTKEQKTVYVRVDNYTPFFYVEINRNWKNHHVDQIIDEVKKRIKNKQNVEGLKKYYTEEKYNFWGFTNYSKFTFLKLIFDSFDAMKSYAYAFSRPYRIFAIQKNPIYFKIYESNLSPMLRFMHIRQLEAVGWVSIPKDKLEELDDNPTICDYNFSTGWTNISKVEDRSIEKFIIASFDIECISEDGSFPQPERDGDQVIQIAVTLSRFGEDECFYKHLLALGKTDDIEGATVEWFKTEKELLLAFPKLIRKLNPDMLTGYYIFGFDFKYLHLRSIKLGIEDGFAMLSRVEGEKSEWKDQVLGSAAIGTSIMKYYEMTGRVVFDLMKVVQRDYKLGSYKLDDVSSYFIREVIQLLENRNDDTFKITTKSTFGLYKEDYITITYIDKSVETKYGDVKFKILELGKNYIVCKGNINMDEIKGCKSYWCQGKDDISPDDIFRMGKGTSAERAIIGKYCVRDAALCNMLVSKLQIITNNVGMANVCHVPLSYLFLRGQGIKIFSLVSKKCREKNHLIPVIKKKEKKTDQKSKQDFRTENQKLHDLKMEKFVNMLNDKDKDQLEDEEDDIGYEGAIVFVPKTGVYFEPIPVLDYASLYPNSMILRNLSHECFVNDLKYDNLPGYKYHVISFKNNDGTFTTCRFAEKLDGTKGIIPEILNDLLNARKKYKKLMEDEPDYFKKSILDSLQLAYKVTANSLYGQTGASTSAIFMKEIAASTTATGREMLQYSKYFIENIYSKAINLALDDKDEYYKLMEQSYKYYPTEASYEDIDRETNQKTLIELHVSTDKNRPIGDHKFIRGSIGYEVDDDFSEFNELFKTMKFGDDKEDDEFIQFVEKNTKDNKVNYVNVFKEKIIKQINGLSVFERETFLNLLKKGKTFKLYHDFEEIWNTIDIFDSKDVKKYFIKKLDNLENDKRNKFFDKLESVISNMGYKGKQEFFDKFYVEVNKVLKGYHVNNEIIYGDSVSYSTPILLRDNNNNYIIKSIGHLAKNIKKYTCDKLQDDNVVYHVWSDNGWTKIRRVIMHHTNKKMYKITTNKGYVEVTEDHSLLDKNKNVLKPKDIIINKTKLLHSFPNLKKINFEVDMSDDEICNIECLKLKQYIDNKSVFDDCTKDECVVLDIIELKNEFNYVYDLETDNHHFNAGVGEIVVHNTDSVFFNPNIIKDKTGEKVKGKIGTILGIFLGIWGGLTICSLLPDPMQQIYEKTLIPFIIQGKKRYVANLYETNPNKYYQKSMGIELKRRDNAPIVKVMCAGIIDQILNKNSAEGAYTFAVQTLQKIITGKYGMEKFIITKTLKGNSLTKEERNLLEKSKEELVVTNEKYKMDKFIVDDNDVSDLDNSETDTVNETKDSKIIINKNKHVEIPVSLYANRSSIVHVVLADRIADRDPGNRPLSNDRIPYVYIETKEEPLLQGDRVESPEYIIQHKLKIDYLFYITNQIMKPALKFLELIVENADSIFKSFIIKEENRKRSMMPIAYYADEKINKDDNNIIIFSDLVENSDKIGVKKEKNKSTNKNKSTKKTKISTLVPCKNLSSLFD